MLDATPTTRPVHQTPSLRVRFATAHAILTAVALDRMSRATAASRLADLGMTTTTANALTAGSVELEEAHLCEREVFIPISSMREEHAALDELVVRLPGGYVSIPAAELTVEQLASYGHNRDDRGDAMSVMSGMCRREVERRIRSATTVAEVEALRPAAQGPRLPGILAARLAEVAS